MKIPAAWAGTEAIRGGVMLFELILGRTVSKLILS
jgi:hypothetical protein